MAKDQRKERVIAFRVEEAIGKHLDQFVVSAEIVNIHSANQMARKVLLDWCNGDLQYRSKAVAENDPSLKISP